MEKAKRKKFGPMDRFVGMLILYSLEFCNHWRFCYSYNHFHKEQTFQLKITVKFSRKWNEMENENMLIFLLLYCKILFPSENWKAKSNKFGTFAVIAKYITNVVSLQTLQCSVEQIKILQNVNLPSYIFFVVQNVIIYFFSIFSAPVRLLKKVWCP